MIELLALLVLNAFLIIGIRMSVDYDTQGDLGKKVIPESKMIFWKISYYGKKYLPSWLYKPLFWCPVCMCSIHSVYVYWGIYDFTGHNFVVYLGYVFSLTGINAYIWNNITFD